MIVEAIKAAVQWLFAPLLAIAVLAWLCVRLEAVGAFDAIARKQNARNRFDKFSCRTTLGPTRRADKTETNVSVF